MSNNSYYLLIFIFSLVLLLAIISFTNLIVPPNDFKEKADFSSQKPQNVIIVVFDALRYDRVSVAGYERNLTSNLDRFINRSVYFKRAYAPGPWTLPSLSTVFTGKYPSQTGVFNWANEICSKEKTFAEAARRKGYKTAGFTGGGALNPTFGFSQGFSEYTFNKTQLSSNFELASEWLDNKSNDNNLVFIHGFDTHSPYLLRDNQSIIYGKDYSGDIPEYLREIDNVNISNYDLTKSGNYGIKMWKYWAPVNFSSLKDREHIRDMYDNKLFYADKAFGRFIENLKENGIYNDSLVIVMSDHGEELFDHGSIKHKDFYEETIRTLLAIKFPEQSEGVVYDKLVSLKDVYPLIIGEVNYSSNFRKLYLNSFQSTRRRKCVFAERKSKRMIFDGRIKLIENIEDASSNNSSFDRQGFRAYNLSDSSKEMKNIISDLPQDYFELLKSKLTRKLKRETRESYCKSVFNLSKLTDN